MACGAECGCDTCMTKAVGGSAWPGFALPELGVAGRPRGDDCACDGCMAKAVGGSAWAGWALTDAGTSARTSEDSKGPSWASHFTGVLSGVSLDEHVFVDVLDECDCLTCVECDYSKYIQEAAAVINGMLTTLEELFPGLIECLTSFIVNRGGLRVRVGTTETAKNWYFSGLERDHAMLRPSLACLLGAALCASSGCDRARAGAASGCTDMHMFAPEAFQSGPRNVRAALYVRGKAVGVELEDRLGARIDASVRLRPLHGGTHTFVEVTPAKPMEVGTWYSVRAILEAGATVRSGVFDVSGEMDLDRPAAPTIGATVYAVPVDPNPFFHAPRFEVPMACAPGERGFVEVVVDGELDEVWPCLPGIGAIGLDNSDCSLSAVALDARHVAEFTVVDLAGNRSPTVRVVLERPVEPAPAVPTPPPP